MDYELAKNLKEAGFPQPPRDGSKTYSGTWYANRSGIEDYFAPTLSELIEACGERFCILKRFENHPVYPGEGWGAREVDTLSVVAEGNGRTPEEAVARLWIALQKNK